MREIILDENYIPDIAEKTAVAIGKFDGIHKGHEKLMEELKCAGSKGLKSVIFTFDMPIAAFFSGQEMKNLTTRPEQEDYLKDLGIDILAIYPVNEKSVRVSPRDFVEEILVKKLNAKKIIAGYDCSFGDRGLGDIALLKSLESELGFETICIDKVTEAETGIEISSTYVRETVEKGDMEHVIELLGRPYSVAGKVSHGRALGRTLSMPTVNIIPEATKLLPPFGVYFSKVYVGTAVFNGITNIGNKPTVNNTKEITVETYIYDFNDDLYGEFIRVELLHHKRGEMKFSSVDELKAQMQRDILAGREYHGN